MKEVKTSKDGKTDYIGPKLLLEKKTVITGARFKRINIRDNEHELTLKIGRYKKRVDGGYDLDFKNPKSELTLTSVELSNLVDYIVENYAPLKDGLQAYINLDSNALANEISKLEDDEEIFNVMLNSFNSESKLKKMADIYFMKKAICEFQNALDSNMKEREFWQNWLENNKWVLGSEINSIVKSRAIDLENHADFLVNSSHKYVDIIEIKDSTKQFWMSSTDHGNWIPSSDVHKAIQQTRKYIHALQLEANSKKYTDRIKLDIIKPEGILIIGRSINWTNEQWNDYRIYFANSDIQVLTFDMLLTRALKLVELIENNQRKDNEGDE